MDRTSPPSQPGQGEPAPQALADALRDAESLFRATFDNPAVGMAHVAPDGRFLRVNATLARLTRYTREELLARTFMAITHPDDQAEDRAQIARLVSGDTNAFSREKRHVRKDGTPLWVNVTVSAVRNARDELQYLFAIVEDITRRKETELELRRAQEHLQQHATHLESAVAHHTEQLQDVAKELGTFSYSIAHDLRAPLRTIRGFGDLLLAECGNSLSPEGKSYLGRILRSAHRMDGLITDVLEYSRLSRAELTIETVDLDQLVRDVLETMPQDKLSQATVNVQHPLLPVCASRSALQQSIGNIVNNALKFVRPGIQPNVTLRTERVDGSVRLWIEDNGTGIAPEHYERIWIMLERLDSRFEGTGVGLSIVRRAVERMNGRVGVESTLGKGSRFWIELPSA